jgi:hypothetical protein
LSPSSSIIFMIPLIVIALLGRSWCECRLWVC